LFRSGRRRAVAPRTLPVRAAVPSAFSAPRSARRAGVVRVGEPPPRLLRAAPGRGVWARRRLAGGPLRARPDAGRPVPPRAYGRRRGARARGAGGSRRPPAYATRGVAGLLPAAPRCRELDIEEPLAVGQP